MLRSRRAEGGPALRAYIATRFDMPEHAVTAFDAERLLRADTNGGGTRHEARAAEFAALLNQSDAARLGGGRGVERREALELLARLGQEAAR